MPFEVVLDANVIYQVEQRNILVRLSQAGLFHARWSNEILDEAFRNVAKNNPRIDTADLNAIRQLLCEAVRDCLIADYEDLVPAINLPHPSDRHVVAAAIRAGAQTIVTNNTKHFPAAELGRYNVQAQTSDEFLLGLIELDDDQVARAIESLARAKRTPRTLDEMLDSLETKDGLVMSVAELRTRLRL